MLLLNANADPERFAAYGLPVVGDGVERYIGPPAGVLAALEWTAARGGARWVVTVPGDAPFIPPDLVPPLHAAGARLEPYSQAPLRGDGRITS